MRVAMVAPGYAPDLGGVETVVTGLARAMTTLGVDVEVWAHDRALHRAQVSDDGGVVVRRFPAKGTARYPVSVDLWRHVASKADEVDLVHGHSFHSVACLGALQQRRPFVFTPHYHGVGHTAVAEALHRVYRPLGRRLVERADVVVGVSNAEAALLRTDFPAVADRLQVVHNGVDAGRITAASPRSEAQPVAVVLGRLEPYKRVDQVLAAFHRVAATSRLVVIGDGPDRGRLEALTAAGARGSDVRFLGRLPQHEVDSWLRTARVVVSMSEREAFGLVALEGAAAGAGVLLSPIPVHQEVAALAPSHIRVCGEDELAPALEELLGRPTRPPAAVRSWEDAAYEHLAVYDRATLAALR